MPFKRGNSWYTKVTLKKGEKPFIRVIPNCTNGQAARDYEAKLRKDAFNEQCYGIKKEQEMTFEEFVRGPYYERHAKHKKDYEDCLHYKLEILITAFGKIPLHKMNFQVIDSFQRQLAKKSPVGVNRYTSVLTTMFNLAETWNNIKNDSEIKWMLPRINPTKGIRIEPESPRDRVLNPDEHARFFPIALNQMPPVYSKMISLSFLMGLRIGEIQKIKPKKDIDFFQNKIRLYNTKSINLAISKNKKNIPKFETVPIPASAMEILMEYFNLPAKYPDDYQPFDWDFRESWGKLCELAKIENFHFHDIRHCFARNLHHTLKVPKSVVAQLLRHKHEDGMATTGIYIGSEPEELLQDAVTKHDSFLHLNQYTNQYTERKGPKEVLESNSRKSLIESSL